MSLNLINRFFILPIPHFRNFCHTQMVDLKIRIIQTDQHIPQFLLGIDLINKSLSNILIQHNTTYDSHLKCYKSEIANYPILASKFKVDPLPPQVSLCKPLFKSISDSDLSLFQSKTTILKSPSNVHSYQWLAAKCMSQTKKIMLSDDMGMGKTISTIAAISIINKWPVLISAPATLIDNWYNELIKWTTLNSHNIIKIRKGTDLPKILSNLKLGMRQIILVTVDLSARNPSHFNNKFQFGVLDEAHSVKNESTQRYKGLSKILSNCEYSILISGTPTTGKIEELYTQLKICRPTLYKDKFQFCARYAHVKEFTTANGFTTKTYSDSKNVDELCYILQSVMIRRKKDDLMPELAPKRRTVVERPISEVDLKTCAALFKRMKKSSKKSDDQILREAMATKGELNKIWLELYRETAKAKIQMTKDYLMEMLERMHGCNDNNALEGVLQPINAILFFCHHQSMLLEMECFLQFTGTPYILIDGDTAPNKRQTLVDLFQTDPRIRVALLSIKAANTGLTLTKASHVVFGEMAWSWGDMAQAEDRCHRIGQLGKVESIVLVGRGTIDKQLWGLLNTKAGIASHCMDGKKVTVDAEMVGQLVQKKEKDLKKEQGQMTLNFNTTAVEDESWMDFEVNEKSLERANQARKPIYSEIETPTKQPQKVENKLESDDSWMAFDIDDAEIERAMAQSKERAKEQENKRKLVRESSDDSWMNFEVDENDYERALQASKRIKKE